MSVLMKNNRNNEKVLSFPKPRGEPEGSTIIVQIGTDRFAIHWQIEDLPRAVPLLWWKPEIPRATSTKARAKPSLELAARRQSKGGQPHAD